MIRLQVYNFSNSSIIYKNLATLVKPRSQQKNLSIGVLGLYTTYISGGKRWGFSHLPILTCHLGPTHSRGNGWRDDKVILAKRPCDLAFSGRHLWFVNFVWTGLIHIFVQQNIEAYSAIEDAHLLERNGWCHPEPSRSQIWGHPQRNL